MKQPSLFGELEGTPLQSSAEKAHKTAGELVGEIKKVVKQAQAFDPFAPLPIRNGDLFIIYGNVPSKSNCYRIITIKPKKDEEETITYSPEQAERIVALFNAGDWKAVRDELNKNDDGSKRSHASLAKTTELKKYEKDFAAQWDLFRKSGNWQTIIGEFCFEMFVYYPSRRSDLDNSLKVVLDCLQTANAIKNDNNCVDIHIRKRLDKMHPRIEFKIIPL